MNIRKVCYIFSVLALLFFVCDKSIAQVHIGNSTGNSHEGALLDLGAKGGLLLPQANLSDTQVYGLAGSSDEAVGMIVYNTNESVLNGDGKGVYLWDGSRWLKAGKIRVSNIDIEGDGEVNVGEDIILTAKVEPDNAGDKTVIWSIVPGGSGGAVVDPSTGKLTGTAVGKVTVQAEAADGSGVTKTFDIMVVCPTLSTPTSISLSPAAPAIMLNGTFTATATAVPGATSYDWTLPSGLLIKSGAGTNSITITSSTAKTYSASGISVQAVNGCGSKSALRYGLGTNNITVHNCSAKPTMPLAIVFSTTSITQNATFTATVPAVSGATSYVWSVPSGLTITAGSGTRSITIKGVTATTYNRSYITVKAVNACGTSDPRVGTGTLTVTSLGDCKYMTVGSRSYMTCDYGGTRWMVENSREGSPTSTTYGSTSNVNGYWYSFSAASSACPGSWRLPNDTEWNSLASYVNSNRGATISKYWVTSAGNAFAGHCAWCDLPSDPDSGWGYWGTHGSWWSSTTYSYGNWTMGHGNVSDTSGLSTGNERSHCWHSVRCVQR